MKIDWTRLWVPLYCGFVLQDWIIKQTKLYAESIEINQEASLLGSRLNLVLFFKCLVSNLDWLRFNNDRKDYNISDFKNTSHVTFLQTTHKCKYFCKCAVLINNLFAIPEKSFSTAAEDAMPFSWDFKPPEQPITLIENWLFPSPISHQSG